MSLESIVHKIAAIPVPYRKEVHGERHVTRGDQAIRQHTQRRIRQQRDGSDDYDMQLRLYLQEVADAIDAALEGLDYLVGSITLATVGTTTVISNSRITANSFIKITATNQNGAASYNSVYVTYADGAITLNHPVSALSRSYKYEIRF